LSLSRAWTKTKPIGNYLWVGDRSMEEIAGIRSLAIGSIELSVGSLPLPFGFVFFVGWHFLLNGWEALAGSGYGI